MHRPVVQGSRMSCGPAKGLYLDHTKTHRSDLPAPVDARSCHSRRPIHRAYALVAVCCRDSVGHSLPTFARSGVHARRPGRAAMPCVIIVFGSGRDGPGRPRIADHPAAACSLLPLLLHQPRISARPNGRRCAPRAPMSVASRAPELMRRCRRALPTGPVLAETTQVLVLQPELGGNKSVPSASSPCQHLGDAFSV